MTSPTHLALKAGAILRDRHRITRVLHKLYVLRDRLTPSSKPTSNPLPASTLRRELGRLIRLESPVDNGIFAEIEYQIKQSRLSHANQGSLIAPQHDGSPTLGKLCYLAARALHPNIIVETGVAHGVTSTYILRALSDNGHGTLHSIDLPPIADADGDTVGTLIPTSHYNRWCLHLGPSQTKLPLVLEEAGRVDLFVHDSLHTHRHMKWEFRTVLNHMRRGMIIADDVHGNSAFEELTRDSRCSGWLVFEQEKKDGLCGVAVIE